MSSQHNWMAVIGCPIEHSLSPSLYEAAFVSMKKQGVCFPVLVSPDNLYQTVELFRKNKPRGFSVTMPHKEKIIAYLDKLSPMAEKIGAVNCVVCSQGLLIGHNTDAPAFINSLRDSLGSPLLGKKILLLGAGGVARACYYSLINEGADVSVVARNTTKIDWIKALDWNQLKNESSSWEVIVDCTSLGQGGDCIDLNWFPDLECVMSLTYHQDNALLMNARNKNHKTINGLDMFVLQGVYALSLWMGHPIAHHVISAMKQSLVNQLKGSS